MEAGCIHNIFDNTCNKYGIICNGTAKQKAICPEWGIVKAYEDSLVTTSLNIPKLVINEESLFKTDGD